MVDLIVFLCFSIASGQVVLVPKFKAPSTLRLGTDGLQLTCRPSGSGYINRIQIERKPVTGSAYSILVYVDPGKDPLSKDDEFRSRAVVKGEAGGVSGAFLEVEMSQAQVNCKEWGYYKCKITYTQNATQTATSESILVNFIVPPSSSPPSLLLSPSNIPNTASGTYRYLRGTTVVMGCRAEVGFPAPLPMRFCLKITSQSRFELVKNFEANYIAPASADSAKSCVMTRTIVASLPITADGKIYCDVYNATSTPGCSSHMATAFETFSVQDFPVCNTSSTDNVTNSTLSITGRATTTIIPSIQNPGLSTASETRDYTVLILGCVLMVISGVLFLTSVLLYLQAQKIRKEAEKAMIRNTYDSVQFNSNTATSTNYSSLGYVENHYHEPLEKQDSDGYVMPHSSFR